MGCKSPINLTLLGPQRNWVRPKIFRSSRVIKAMLIKTGKRTLSAKEKIKTIS
jgi:hypothetical protein